MKYGEMMLLFPNIYNLTQTDENSAQSHVPCLNILSSQVDHQQDNIDSDPKGAKIEYMFSPPGNIH